jgi:hypothetical protein
VDFIDESSLFLASSRRKHLNPPVRSNG